MSYELDFIKALILTLSIELATGLLLRTAERKFTLPFKTKLKAIPITKFIAGVLFASTLTLPYVWFFFPVLIRDRLPFTITAELFAFLMEALFYSFSFEFNWKNSLSLSFSLNLVSFCIGLLIF